MEARQRNPGLNYSVAYLLAGVLGLFLLYALAAMPGNSYADNAATAMATLSGNGQGNSGEGVAASEPTAIAGLRSVELTQEGWHTVPESEQFAQQKEEKRVHPVERIGMKMFCRLFPAFCGE